MNTVSVIIPAYNREKYLSRAIDSALNQNSVSTEIIVVDDGSSDNTQKILESYKDRISYHINATNLGSQKSRNHGVSLATADVIAFLDSDDYWREDKLLLQLARAYASGSTKDFCVTCGHALIDSDGPPFLPPENIGLEEILVHNVVGPTSNILVSRSVLDAVGTFDPSMPSCQDWELFARIAQQVPILGVREVLTFQDTDSSARISDNRKKVRDGHRTMYQRTRKTAGFRSLPLGHQLIVRARQELALLRR